jgi:hypothetical protein
MVFEPGAGDKKQDQDDHKPLLRRGEDKQVEEALHFVA